MDVSAGIFLARGFKKPVPVYLNMLALVRPAKTPASALLKPAMHGEALKAVEVMSLKERNLETIN
jgi:hypothetical protein